MSKAHPKCGLVQLEWNMSGSLLLARFGMIFCSAYNQPYLSHRCDTDTAPRALFIYSFPSPSERFQPSLRTVLLQTRSILAVRWNPVRPGSLALCCGEGGIYTWSNEWSSGDRDPDKKDDEEMAECIGVPTRMTSFDYLLSPALIFPCCFPFDREQFWSSRYSVGTRWERSCADWQRHVLLRFRSQRGGVGVQLTSNGPMRFIVSHCTNVSV